MKSVPAIHEDAFRSRLYTSRKWLLKMEVVQPSTQLTVMTITNGLSGTVNEERTQVRRNFDMELQGGSGLTPGTDIIGELHRYGDDGDTYEGLGGFYGDHPHQILDGIFLVGSREVKISRGMDLGGGVVLWFNQGIFRLSGYSTTDKGAALSVQLSGADRSVYVSNNRWRKPYTVSAGNNYVVAIEALIRNRFPRATFDFPTTSYLTPSLVFGLEADNDPWADAQSMAASISMELFVNADGVFCMRPLPKTYHPTVETLDEGPLDMKVSVTRAYTEDQVYNVVVVRGTNTSIEGESVYAEAEITDPDHPLYADPEEGDFGPKVYFFNSELMGSIPQAAAAADSILEDVSAFAEEIEVEMAYHPLLETSDVVYFVCSTSGLSGAYIVQAITKPISETGRMTVRLRREIG